MTSAIWVGAAVLAAGAAIALLLRATPRGRARAPAHPGAGPGLTHQTGQTPLPPVSRAPSSKAQPE